MGTNVESEGDKARASVEELFKTLITVSGLILTLLWGLTQRELTETILGTIQVASVAMVFSIFSSILGMQFIVTKLHHNVSNISKTNSVSLCFLASWLAFLVGCVALIVAILQVK